MSWQLFCKVLMFISWHLSVNAKIQPYPLSYYQQRFGGQFQQPFQQYPQLSIPNYSNVMPLYPYPPIYPNNPLIPGIPQFGAIPEQEYLPSEPLPNIPEQQPSILSNEMEEEEETFFPEEDRIDNIRKPIMTSSIVKSTFQFTTYTKTLDSHVSKTKKRTHKSPKKQDNSNEEKKQDNSNEKEQDNSNEKEQDNSNEKKEDDSNEQEQDNSNEKKENDSNKKQKKSNEKKQNNFNKKKEKNVFDDNGRYPMISPFYRINNK